MRPSGESVSCPHSRYVGHVGRQNPQWTQSSNKSRFTGARLYRGLTLFKTRSQVKSALELVMAGRLSIGALLLSSGMLCASIGLASPEIRVPNLASVLVNPLQASPTTKAVVLVFVSTEFPYSNRSAPETRRIHDPFEPRGVRFWLVYTNPADTAAIIRSHLQTVGDPHIALRDSRHDVVKIARAPVTPEARVVDGS